MSIFSAIASVFKRDDPQPLMEGVILTTEIAKAIERGQRPSDDLYRLAIASLGLDRDDALMSMFGEKGRDRVPSFD